MIVDDRHLENRRRAISPQPLHRSERNFENHCLLCYLIKLQKLLKQNWLQFLYVEIVDSIKEQKSKFCPHRTMLVHLWQTDMTLTARNVIAGFFALNVRTCDFDFCCFIVAAFIQQRETGASFVLIFFGKCNRSSRLAESTDATTLWDPWDASPPTLENLGTKCIWSRPTFLTVTFSYGSTCDFRGT